ncbi:hypothetical protein PUN28_010608 [Cardiocondyla obscurior]|uniref:Uncharacterized protein n=1 Tax=Cardiocondyla obscurior TaxID=286306 RepID=A0AAW2FIR2_9HYME
MAGVGRGHSRSIRIIEDFTSEKERDIRRSHRNVATGTTGDQRKRPWRGIVHQQSNPRSAVSSTLLLRINDLESSKTSIPIYYETPLPVPIIDSATP